MTEAQADTLSRATFDRVAARPDAAIVLRGFLAAAGLPRQLDDISGLTEPQKLRVGRIIRNG